MKCIPHCSQRWCMCRHCSRLWHYFLLLISFGKFLTTTNLKNRRCERRPYFLLLTGRGLVFPRCYWWWRMRRSSCHLWPYFLVLNAFGKFLTTTGLRIKRRRENSVFMGRKQSPPRILICSTVFIQEIYLVKGQNIIEKLLLMFRE
jgi:hypothetical protein